jgi:hypothetical protein
LSELNARGHLNIGYVQKYIINAGRRDNRFNSAAVMIGSQVFREFEAKRKNAFDL